VAQYHLQRNAAADWGLRVHWLDLGHLSHDCQPCEYLVAHVFRGDSDMLLQKRVNLPDEVGREGQIGLRQDVPDAFFVH
jgi:hypothetical protein